MVPSPSSRSRTTDFLPLTMAIVLLAMGVIVHGVLQSAARVTASCTQACPCGPTDRPPTLPAVP